MTYKEVAARVVGLDIAELRRSLGLTQRDAALVLEVEDVASQVEDGLEAADWLTRREIIRTLVSRLEIDHTQVNRL